jgi:hypothetical protein
MRTLLVILIACVAVAKPSKAQDFNTEFREVFGHSVKGFSDWLSNGTLTRNFPSISGVQTVVKDDDLGVLVFQSNQSLTGAGEAETAKTSLEGNIEKALPAGQFSKRTTYSLSAGCMKTIFEFKSDKMAEQQKRPSVEVYVTEQDGSSSVVFRIAEPYFKNQYTPSY